MSHCYDLSLDTHENWWNKALHEAKMSFQNVNMNLQSQAEWIRLLNNVENTERFFLHS